MSKILKAVQKSKFDVDIDFQLSTVGQTALFPQPPREQKEEFAQLANSLINLQSADQGIVVTFCSTSSGEGASYVSYNTARYISWIMEKDVAWIDANFHSPRLPFDDDVVDFRSLLLDPDLLDRLPHGPQFTVVPHGDRHIKQTEYLRSDNYNRLLMGLSERYPFTIIDAPPMSSSIDVGHLARATSGLVVVVAARRLKHEVIQENLQAMQNSGVHVLGTVLNQRSFDIPGFLYRRMS